MFVKMMSIFALLFAFASSVGAQTTPAAAVESNSSAQAVATESSSAAAKKAAEDPAQAFMKKWTSKDKFDVRWSMNGSSQVFTAYPKNGEFNFHSSDYCERGTPKAEFFAKDGKFIVRILRKNNGCTPAIMIFDPATGQGLAAEEAAGQYNVLPGRTLTLVE